MASITLKGVSQELLDELREEAERERRSVNQQAIYLLESALKNRRAAFLDRLEAFYEAEGLPEDDLELDELRDAEPGRSAKF